MLTVAYPRPGLTISERMVEFSGSTEPGCAVLAAGIYPVEVTDDGTWSIVLVLEPGGNVAVFEAEDAAGNRTEARIPVYYTPALVMAHDGLGAVSFGDPMEVALAVLVARFGPPSEDIIIESPFGTDFPHGYSATDYFRHTFWDEPVSLSVVFSDHDRYFRTDGLVHFINWAYWGDELVTSEGLGVGATVAELKEQYGQDLLIHPHCIEIGYCDFGEWTFSINPPPATGLGAQFVGLEGSFVTDPVDPQTQVGTWRAGPRHSP
jgi:hypothetical protein